MRLRNSTEGYGAASQLFHWLTVLLVVVAWLTGVLSDELPKGAPRQNGMFVHIMAGLSVLTLLIARLLWRTVDGLPPDLAAAPAPWLDILARLAHLALYVLLLAVTVIGIMVQFKRGNALPLFGLADIPSPFTADRPTARSLKEVHGLLAHGLMLLAGVHAAAALAHHWLFRDRTLVRMLPGSLR